MESLDAVDDRHIGLESFQLLQHQLQIGLRQQLQIGTATLQPLPTQLHLLGGFLRTHVEHGAIRPHGRGTLQQQGAFPDSRVSSHQHQRSRHQATPEHPVEFVVPTGQALHGLVAKIGHGRRSAGHWSRLGIGSSPAPPSVVFGLRLLHQGVPAAAATATTKELPGLCPAALADIGSDRTGHEREREEVEL